MTENDFQNRGSAESVIADFTAAVGMWRRLEKAFPIREHYRYQIFTSASAVTDEALAANEREYWNRLVLAANCRKFFWKKDTVFLPNVVRAFIELGLIQGDDDEVALLEKRIGEMHAGKPQIGSYQMDGGKALSAYQVVDALLHGAFLHGDSKKDAIVHGLGEALTHQALWEWLATYRPLLNHLASYVEQAQNKTAGLDFRKSES